MNGNAYILYQETEPKKKNKHVKKVTPETMFQRFGDIMSPLSRNRKSCKNASSKGLS